MSDGLLATRAGEDDRASYKREIGFGVAAALYLGMMVGLLFYHSLIFTESKNIDYSAYRLESLNLPDASEE